MSERDSECREGSIDEGPQTPEADLLYEARLASEAHFESLMVSSPHETAVFTGRGYALRSATEVQSHLYVALDQAYISQEQFDELYGRNENTKNLIRGFSSYLRRQSNKHLPGEA